MRRGQGGLPLKFMIMTDMEGCAGVLDHDDWVRPEGRYYEKGMRFLTEEVNAAVAGFFDGGATEVLVVDGHGYGGIDPELLDERAELQHGLTQPTWPWGLDESFDALAFVGQHAKSGTPFSHITHTGSFEVLDISINGISMGEYGLISLCAMELGVPTVLACGDEALAHEAEDLTPGVVTVAVKRGLLPDGLEEASAEEYATAKLSAVHLSPARARELIHSGALDAARRLREEPESFRYPDLRPPYVRMEKMRRRGEEPGGTARAEHASSLIALMNTPSTPVKEGR